MQQSRTAFVRPEGRYSVALIVAAIVAVVCVLGFTAAREPVASPPALVSARTCAIRTVYHVAQDDWGQRALIAASVLNNSPAPGAVMACTAPPVPAEDGTGGFPDAYRLQSARDAVAAVADRNYELPRACAGVTAFTSPEAAPRSQCVYAGLAFTTEGT